MTSQIPPAPKQVGERVWRAADVADPAGWTWRLTDAQIDELIAATRDAGTGRFDLPTVGPMLLRLRERLTHGRGFEVISGFPATEVGADVSAVVFAGLGRHLGLARSQNAAGEVLGHVRNVGADAGDPSVRIYQTDRRQTFHTDSSDVVGLMCLETAASGGDSLLVSAGAIYNEMIDRDPGLAAVLFEPIATDRRGEVPPGSPPYFTIPVLNWFAETLTIIYQRQYIESAQRFEATPRLTDRVVTALDVLDEIANDPAMHLQMRFQVGDMQFVHNHSMLHDRTAFVDKPGSPRHLLRLWLSVPGDRELPPVFAQRYGSIEVGHRGGIVVGHG